MHSQTFIRCAGEILIVEMITDIKVEYVDSKIMNQLSYHVSDDKLKSRGLILKENLDKDIKSTLEILKNIS